jgi:hypothetical protein
VRACGVGSISSLRRSARTATGGRGEVLGFAVGALGGFSGLGVAVGAGTLGVIVPCILHIGSERARMLACWAASLASVAELSC